MSHGLLSAVLVAEASKTAAADATRRSGISGGGISTGEQLGQLGRLQRLAEAVSAGEIRPAYLSVSAEDFNLIAEFYSKPRSV